MNTQNTKPACPADNVSTPVYSKTSAEPTASRADVNGEMLADMRDIGVAFFALMLYPDAPTLGGFMEWEIENAEHHLNAALDAVARRRASKLGREGNR
jgi:hypothetical protein